LAAIRSTHTRGARIRRHMKRSARTRSHVCPEGDPVGAAKLHTEYHFIAQTHPYTARVN